MGGSVYTHYSSIPSFPIPLFHYSRTPHLINFLRMHRRERNMNKREKSSRYTMLKRTVASLRPSETKRVSSTRWYKGNASDKSCAHPGSPETGKKVPLNRNIGVINRKMGRLKRSMVGTIPVKYIPIAPKASPPKNAQTTPMSPRGK